MMAAPKRLVLSDPVVTSISKTQVSTPPTAVPFGEPAVSIVQTKPTPEPLQPLADRPPVCTTQVPAGAENKLTPTTEELIWTETSDTVTAAISRALVSIVKVIRYVEVVAVVEIGAPT
jgi:hypothetical protein